MPIQIDVAELAGLIAEGCLYGAFLVLFFIAFHTLTRKRRRSRLSPAMTVASVLMMVLATCQISVDIVNIFWAFVPFDRDQRILFLLDVTRPIFAAKHAIYFTMMLVGDGIVTHRAFIVWGRNYWLIILPVLCSLGSAICAYQTIFAVRHIATTTIAAQTSWGIAVFSLSLAANAMSTSLIAYKLWTHEQSIRRAFTTHSGTVAHSRGRSLMPIVRVIAESGAVNAAYLLAYIIVLVTGTHALEIMACISTPLIGILFGTVIIRAAMSPAEQYTTTAPNNGRDIGIPLVSQAPVLTSKTAVHVNMEWTSNAKDFNDGRKASPSSSVV